MSTQRTYKNVVFTKHAAERMALRSITEYTIWEVIAHPDEVRPEKQNSKRYIKTINTRRYFVVAAYIPNEKKYLVISCWVRGEDDAVPLVWILLTAPFKIIWKLVTFIIRRISKL